MAFPVAAALGVGGALAGSLMEGQFNAKEAAKNRKWQQFMSSTQFSRAAHDLKSAGLNRILALGEPASMGAGSSASISKPNLTEAGVMAASAKQQIELQRAEESLVKQKESESGSAEALNRAMEVTQATQQGLNIANANSAASQAKLLDEQARKTRLDADRGELLNPFYKLGGDITKWIDGFLRNSAKGTPKLVEDVKKMLDLPKHYQNTFGGVDSKIQSIIDAKPDGDAVRRQSWPKFKRGSKK